MRRARIAAKVACAAILVSLLASTARAAQPQVKIEDLEKALVEDANYKVRVTSALVLGRLGDHAAVPSLVKALSDGNKTVRAIAAQALGQLADHDAAEPLRELLKREGDPFVRTQTEKALALVSGDEGQKKAKIYLTFGPFTSGVKSAGADVAKVIHDALARELGKVQGVTLDLTPAEQKSFPKTGLLGFYIDGNITRLDDMPAGNSSETSCDVKVMVARWPSKAIVSWTNAGASLQSGARPQDKVNARKDCLEASVGQLAEDLGKFFKAQGG